MGRVLGWLGQCMRWPHARRFDRLARTPRKAQEELLQEILGLNADTVYGRERGFARLKSLDAYRRQVPIVSAEDLRPYVERMKKGEERVLTREKPLYYCCTSGTTGEPKFNAVTPMYRDQYQKTVHVFLYHLFRDHPAAYGGEILYFVGSDRLGETEDGTPYGTMSGYNYSAMPALARKAYAVPYAPFQIADLDWKYYVLVRLALLRPLSFAVAITPTPLNAFARCLEEETERLLRDVHDGGLKGAEALPSALMAELAPRMAPDPARARQLERLASRGPLTPTAAWPGLALLSSWIGAAAGLYVPELRKRYPGIPIRDAIYSATEGWCTIPLEDERLGGPLAIQSHVYEFIPEEELENPSPPVLAVDEIEAGRNYAILLTTGGGQYRYDLKDVLRCEGFHHGIPWMRFLYKGKHCFNLAGEKMTEGHVNEAISRWRDEAGLALTWFVAVPRKESGNAGYELWIETEASLAGADETLDALLREVNWEYGSHRDCRDLAPLSVHRLAPGTWARLRQAMAAAGAQEAQIKPPHLTDKAGVVDALTPA